MLYRRNDNPPAPLPFRAIDGTGRSWTDLANNAEGRTACGFAPGPDKPTHDPERERVVWDSDAGDWTVEQLYTDAEWLAKRKAGKRAALAAKRYAVETGGITVGGMAVPTDRTTQDRVDQIVKAYADGDISGAIDFKARDVWVTLDEATVQAIKTAGAQHIQACFSNERSIDGRIVNAADMAALDAIDIETGW